MPQSAEWACKVRCSIAGLPRPVGYRANRAIPCSQFICREALPVYYETLCHIFKIIFDGCGTIIKWVGGDWKYDTDFVWCSTDHYPTVWHLAQAWLRSTVRMRRRTLLQGIFSYYGEIMRRREFFRCGNLLLRSSHHRSFHPSSQRVSHCLYVAVPL